MALPRITLITPSYNQAAYLEQTIQSVLDQGYTNLQYGVVDGGSTDGSVQIIERYHSRLDFVIIEPDDGQSDAINKGLARADGAVLGWLNSDDTLLAGALYEIGRRFEADDKVRWLIGHGRLVDAAGRPVERLAVEGEFTLAGALIRRRKFNVPQPSSFWRRQVTDKVGLLDTSLRHCMDFDLWCRFLAAGVQPTLVDAQWSTYRLHDASKTCAESDGFIRSLIDIERRYAHLLPLRQRLELHRRIGYQRRACAVRTAGRQLWKAVVRRPWWLGSQQVRRSLLGQA